MDKSTCRAIQRKLEELLLDENPGSDISQHLAGCPVCTDFQLKQVKLRRLVGSLGTVSAPADFDFRLRSRLAEESTHSPFHSSIGFRSLRYRNVAAGVVVALLVAAAFFIFQLNRSNAPQMISKENPPQKVIPAPTTKTSPVDDQNQKATNQPSLATAQTPKNASERRMGTKNVRAKRPAAIAEFSFDRAPVVRNSGNVESTEAIFPVDASQQSLRISLFDSRGNPRTISLPTVSFGSQRVVPTATSFAQKGVW